MTLRKLVFLTLILSSIPTLGTAPLAVTDAPLSTVEKVLQRGVLKVGISTFVPWVMKDKIGRLIGFEIDVARRLAEDMGVKVKFVPTKWSGIIPP